MHYSAPTRFTQLTANVVRVRNAFGQIRVNICAETVLKRYGAMTVNAPVAGFTGNQQSGTSGSPNRPILSHENLLLKIDIDFRRI